MRRREAYWHSRPCVIVGDYETDKPKLIGLFVWVDCQGYPTTLAPVSSLKLAFGPGLC